MLAESGPLPARSRGPGAAGSCANPRAGGIVVAMLVARRRIRVSVRRGAAPTLGVLEAPGPRPRIRRRGPSPAGLAQLEASTQTGIDPIQPHPPDCMLVEAEGCALASRSGGPAQRSIVMWHGPARPSPGLGLIWTVVCQVGRVEACRWGGLVVVRGRGSRGGVRAEGRDGMVSLIFEGWVPQDHRFVAGSLSRIGRRRRGVGCP